MMNKKELCDYIQKYGNTQYKKGYDAGRSDERKLIKAKVLQEIQKAYEQGVKDGKQKAIETMKDQAKHSYVVTRDGRVFTTAGEWYREEFIDD